MENKEKGKLVQMRLSEDALDRIDRLIVLIGSKGNKTQLITDVLKFAEDLIVEMRNGNKVYIERKDGDYRVQLPDLKY